MRTEHSIKNMYIGVSTQIIIAMLGFISRKVFLDSLGLTYLGINGLLTNVLAMLALVESGIGTGIVYSLYKPLAVQDYPKIIALIQLYKRAYAILAGIIFVISLIFYPFLGYFLKGQDVGMTITIAYFLFVAKNAIAYLNAHKVSLITADQKEYIILRINFLFQLLGYAGKIIILLWTENYLLYLIVEVGLFLIQTLINGNIVNKQYSYIKTKIRYSLDELERKQLITNIKALFLHSISGFCVTGTDNLLISAFIGVAVVGIYSNYTMIIGQLGTVLAPLLDGFGASVGNLIALENKEKRYSIFRVTYFINFWIYSVGVIFLYCMLEPFINWWLGKGYLLDSLTYILILVNFYVMGMRSSILIFKVKGGLFVQDQYFTLLEAGVNLIASCLLVMYMGLPGIFLGTLISTLTTVFWNSPRIVYKYLFDKQVFSYFKTYVFYACITIGTGILTVWVADLTVRDQTFVSLLVRGCISVFVPCLVYSALFYKTNEFIYIKEVVLLTLRKVKRVKLPTFFIK